MSRDSDILTFPRWEKTCIGVEQPSTGHWQEGIGEREEGVWIGDCSVWTETAEGGERICEEKSVSELSLLHLWSSGLLHGVVW
jgi:hypothetical protein